jgi:uncharacterized membrane protein YfcA
MPAIQIIGFLACGLIGISLGLIGAGGSILMIPVLVFLFNIPPQIATTYSLFVVGMTSMFSATNKFKDGNVLIKCALSFGITSMIAVVVVRRFLIPVLPKFFGHIGNFAISYDLLSMLLFAMLMIVAAIFMVKRKAIDTEFTHSGSPRWFGTIPHALLVGIVTGLLGAGGGFLIVPVMTLYLSIDIKKAIGTSLAIVAINSLSGFANDLTRVYIHWGFMFSITSIAVAGSILGSTLSRKINTTGLKVGFGWFIMCLGLLIITKECYQFFIQH